MRRQVVAGPIVLGAWIVGLILATDGGLKADGFGVADRDLLGQPPGQVNDRDVAH